MDMLNVSTNKFRPSSDVRYNPTRLRCSFERSASACLLPINTLNVRRSAANTENFSTNTHSKPTIGNSEEKFASKLSSRKEGESFPSYVWQHIYVQGDGETRYHQ